MSTQGRADDAVADDDGAQGPGVDIQSNTEEPSETPPLEERASDSDRDSDRGAASDAQEEGDERTNILAEALKTLVGRVVNDGVGPLTGSIEYAHARLREPADRFDKPDDPFGTGYQEPGSTDAEQAIKRIVRESVLAAGTSGFVTGLGGLVTLPVTLPANLAGNLVINARMVGAIAYLRGYSLRDPHTQAVLMLVVAGSSAQKAMSTLGVKLGREFSKQVIKAIPITVIRRINQKAGFMLLAKYGTKRAGITLAKGVPIVGGVVGGAVDASLTQFIASSAKSAFPL